MSDIWVPDDGSWIPHAPGSATSRREIADVVTGRIPDHRYELKRELWRLLYPLMTSTGWRRFRDTELDATLDLIEKTYKGHDL